VRSCKFVAHTSCCAAKQPKFMSCSLQLPYAVTIALVSLACSLTTGNTLLLPARHTRAHCSRRSPAGSLGIHLAPLCILAGTVVIGVIIRFAGTQVENFQFDNGGRVREMKSFRQRAGDCWNRVRSRSARQLVADDSEMSLVEESQQPS
jgi:hypothetical protein